jgi:hypothetical protein
MDPESLLPCQKEPFTGPNPVHTIRSYLSKIHLNIIHLPTHALKAPSKFCTHFMSGTTVERNLSNTTFTEGNEFVVGAI